MSSALGYDSEFLYNPAPLLHRFILRLNINFFRTTLVEVDGSLRINGCSNVSRMIDRSNHGMHSNDGLQLRDITKEPLKQSQLFVRRKLLR
eukprot:3820570-Alexandrium_andersonii.AAC.1